MTFPPPVPLPASKVRALQRSFRRGRTLYRGIKPADQLPADPGDLGIGSYHSSSKLRARCYGTLTKAVVRLRHPLVLSNDQAYAFVDDHFHTVHCSRSWEDRKVAATAATRVLRCLGFDGLVAVASRGRDELEVVLFPPQAFFLPAPRPGPAPST